MARKSAEVRREEILAATVEEIEATGLRTLRVADVAERLGLSASLVIYHFATKEALVAAAFDHAGRNDLDHARNLAAGTGSARERLSEVIGWYMPAGSTRSWKIWIDGWSAGLFDEDLKSTFSALDRDWKTILADLIVEGIGSGEVASRGDEAGAQSADGFAEACATRILAYLDGLAVQLLFNSDSVSQEKLRAWVGEFLTSELD
ncbi:TetR/AcrR family transcriptional regulator [Brevibacterium renqingii]|uniref:TetR/AcrR family transcriptional regulator n=1 Tax=Brevibacterium renqingii TaxID=2776916 RepID=UPI001ADFB5C9|nr:TetR family transcriptional regulator C-terminal domain-containing protein [Brevibacterium renqingii]